jgi:peroxiredoxin
MPVYNAITYSRHAEQRMRIRGLSRQDVELALRIGDGFPEDDGTYVYELDRIRVVIVERGAVAHVVTVIKMRKHA